MAGAVALLAALTLQHGVQMPAESFDHVTWDPVLKQTPNRSGRRWGTRKLVDTTLIMLRQYHDAHPDAPRVLVGDRSRRHGGFFGKRYGGLGHAQELVDRFVDAGAIRVFVGPLVYHDDHLHVRLSPRGVNLPVAG